MATNYAPPSVSLADRDSLPGMMRLVLTKLLQNTDDMLPARVISYERSANRADVQPLIAMVTTDNKRISRAPVANIPVIQLGGGGFVASFPIKTGDIGWIKASDSDISLFKQAMAETTPNTERLHSFEDGLFIPDTMLRAVTIAPEDADNFVIQNTAGTVKVAWWANLIKIIAPRVGIGGTPDTNAILDVQSTTKASMPFPRMTQSQRNAIPSPHEGMCVWNTTTHGISVYNGSTWS